jgi:DeoR family transcriptional regulator of aga operon
VQDPARPRQLGLPFAQPNAWQTEVLRTIVHAFSHRSFTSAAEFGRWEAERGRAVDRYARWNALLELLTESGRVSVEDAAAKLDVSQATIRRDFDQLAQQQMITRTRGGAVANGVSYDLPLRYKTAKHSAEKQRIGTAAAALVSPGMVVGLNGGTTTTEVARALAVRPDLAGGVDGAQLTVVTNALNIANELLVRSRMKIVVTGGVVRPQSFELLGPLGGGILREVTLDVVLLGVDALDVQLGAAAHHEGEAAMNNLMVARARRVVIIADSSKLGAHAFARICPLERIDTLVTDSGATPDIVTAFRAAGLDVICA